MSASTRVPSGSDVRRCSNELLHGGGDDVRRNWQRGLLQSLVLLWPQGDLAKELTEIHSTSSGSWSITKPTSSGLNMMVTTALAPAATPVAPAAAFSSCPLT